MEDASKTMSTRNLNTTPLPLLNLKSRRNQTTQRKEIRFNQEDYFKYFKKTIFNGTPISVIQYYPLMKINKDLKKFSIVQGIIQIAFLILLTVDVFNSVT